jgi:hypothetical protein
VKADISFSNMPLADPRIQSAVEELKRRGVNLSVKVPDAAPAPMIGAAVPAISDESPAPMIGAADVAPVEPAAPAAAPSPDYSSPRDVERQLRLKRAMGDLAIQDSVNELKRRGVNLQLKTQPAQEEVTTRAANEAVENARKEGDPEAFKNAWRQLFPGRPLPRKDGQIDYAGGQDDIDVEMDRRKQLESAKVGVHNVSETKVTETDPQTGKDNEYLVRTDKATGQVLGKTLIGSTTKPLTESQANAKMFSSRMATNNGTLLGIEAKGFDPTAFGTTVQSFLPNRFQSGDLQAYNAAKQNWIAAVLRKESGAAISSKEYSDANKQYFPQDGDSKAVVQQKQSLRQQVEQQMREASGPHLGGPSAAPASAPAAPAASGVVDVTSAADAPPTAKFIRSPSGRVYRNPKYQGQ